MFLNNNTDSTVAILPQPPAHPNGAVPSLVATALAYRAAGRSVLPIAPGEKRPSVLNASGEVHGIAWDTFKTTAADETTIKTWFPPDRLMGMGIACGPVSGLTRDGVTYALEVLDVDDEPTLVTFSEAAAFQGLSELLQRLLHQRTPGGAGHYAYLCQQWEGNLKLATRQNGVDDKGKPQVETLIETRGAGGQAIVAPTPPGIHPEHPERGYTLVRGSWDALSIITPDERKALLDLARSFNAYVEPLQVYTARGAGRQDACGTRPGDILNRTADLAWWRELLERHDWTLIHQRGSIQYWRRPGKDGQAWSATLGACGEYFYVFSSNASPFDPEHAYSPFNAYALLDHNGDFRTAAQALAPSRTTRRNGHTPTEGEPQAEDAGGSPLAESFYGPAQPKAQPQSEIVPYSDYTNALALVRQHGQDLRYCHPWKKWLTWSGSHWHTDDTGAVMRRGKQTILRLLRRAEHMTDQEKIDDLLRHVKKSLYTAPLKAMLESAQSEETIPVLPEALDRDPWLLNCANGTLDLQTGTLQPHARADLLTKALSVAYDPEAQCSEWKAFLWKILDKSQALITFLQRAIGYSLTGETSEQCLFILWGSGANGKSTFVNTLLSMLGPYGMKATADLLMVTRNDRHPTERADLFGMRFVAAIETDEGARLNEVFVKEATGGDPIRARRMREDFWQFDPSHKVFLATNHRPVIRGTDHAIWRRIKLVPFTVTIPAAEQDKQLPAKLIKELPGILAWAVRGCLDGQQHGLGEPAEVTEATATYRQDMDVFEEFLANECFRLPGAMVKASDLYDAYQRWCQTSDVEALSKRAFGLRLADSGCTAEKGTAGVRLWKGIGLPSKDKEDKRSGA